MDNQKDALAQLELVYQKALELNPYYYIAYNNMGCIYLRQNNLSKAQDFFEKAVNICPEFADARYNLANIFTKKCLFDDAIEQLDIILTLEPENSRAHHKKAQLSYQQEKFIPAMHHYQEFLKFEPNDIHALHNLGSIFLKLHDPEEAAKYFLRLLPLASDGENYFNLGIAYMEQEKHKEAVIYFEQALQAIPDYIEAHINLGAVYLKLEDYPSATKHYQEIMRLQPDNNEIAYILNAINNNKENYHAAPQAYIQNLFDQYAPHYEQHLMQILDSKIPSLIYDAVAEAAGHLLKIEKHLDILDLGCGTGLTGEKFSPYANQLIGIDLSEKMLTQARQKNIYSELLLADISQSINKYHDLDLVIAADTLVYIGDLDQIFDQLAIALKPDGIFAFTIEKTSHYPYELQNTARFAHNTEYLQNLSAKYHFDIILYKNIILRKHRNGVIEGLLYVLKKSHNHRTAQTVLTEIKNH
jgi:predicted TPR repeat methyltransferase